MSKHLNTLEQNLIYCCRNLTTSDYEWIRNPFITSQIKVYSLEEEELIHL